LHSVIRGYCSSSFRLAAVALLLLAVVNGTLAQISPGELSSVHADLEGITKCTSCHTLGKAVSNTNCLACHAEVKTRMEAGTGLHGKYAQRQCVECHKEHHGRDFSLVRFDSKTFDHGTTGYALDGKHVTLQCNKCHARDHIRAPDVLANKALLAEGTYQGLSRECLSCHADEHGGQLSRDCLQCHTTAGWKPAARFSHEHARFQLNGKHAQVECARCHKRAAGSPAQFTRMEFSECSACHRDPHAGRFTEPCSKCHTTAGWNQGPARTFDHSVTRFPLRGKHANVRCEQCHGVTKAGKGPDGSRNFHIVKFSQCTDCHTDPHSGQFTKNPTTPTCASCHTEAGWKEGKARTFDHAQTKFPLRGKHATTACTRCHGSAEANHATGTAGRVDVKRFARCEDCHSDPHGGQFVRQAGGGACESCHSEQGFSPSTFTVERHGKTDFALRGAHEAIPCTRCHQVPSQGTKAGAQFVWNKEVRCLDCHKNVHGELFKGVTVSDCGLCHSPEGWKSIIYRHDKTSFALTGKHAGVSCALCHGPHARQSKSDSTTWRFRETPSRCIDCHPQRELEQLKNR